MPMIIEIVDTLEKIDNFMPLIDHTITEGLAIIEEIRIRFYRTSWPGIFINPWFDMLSTI